MKRVIPDDFCITEPMRAWARAKCPRLDVDHHTEEFVDYWIGTGKAMANWEATWRNWMRRTFEGRFGPARLVTVNREAVAKNVHDIALHRSARAHGIDPTGMSENEINNAIWQMQQARRSS